MDEFNKTPLSRREYITANDPRDIIDLYGKKTLIDGKKENTQKGIVEYHAIVVATEKQGLPRKTGWMQSMLNFFTGKDTAPGDELQNMSTFIGYIVGPQPVNQGERLPHDNIPPPCSLLRANVASLDRDTRSSLVMLQNVGTFLVVGQKTPAIGSKVRVSFSQMPSAGVMRGGMYIGPITSNEVNDGIDEKIQRKCAGNSTDGSVSGFARGQPSVSSTRQTPSSGQIRANIIEAMGILTTSDKCKIFKGENLTQAQAAGVVGNLRAESSMDSGATNPNDSPDCTESVDLYKNSYGLAQWNCQRARGLAVYADKRAEELGSIPLSTQVEYICHELNTTEAEAAERLKDAKTAEEAAEAMFWYERFAGYPGDKTGNKSGTKNYHHGQRTMATRRGFAEEAKKTYAAHLETQKVVRSLTSTTTAEPISGQPLSTAGSYYSLTLQTEPNTSSVEDTTDDSSLSDYL